MVEALKKENVRLVRALRQLSDKCTQLERELRQGSFVKKAALPAPAPAPAAREALYTIRSGDTLSGIAQSYGISLRSLMQANGLNGSSILRAGQVLRIPGQ
jgi:lysozyme